MARCHDSVKSISANIPHCTLMVVNALSSHQRAIMGSLGRISFAPLSLELGGPDVFLERDRTCSLVAKINLSEPLRALHLRVAEAMKPFIDWSQTPKWQDYTPFQGDEARREAYLNIFLFTVTDSRLAILLFQGKLKVGDGIIFRVLEQDCFKLYYFLYLNYIKVFGYGYVLEYLFGF